MLKPASAADPRIVEFNECDRCGVRMDGRAVTFCVHEAWDLKFPGNGRIISPYPPKGGAPAWCPGMVPLIVRME